MNHHLNAKILDPCFNMQMNCVHGTWYMRTRYRSPIVIGGGKANMKWRISDGSKRLKALMASSYVIGMYASESQYSLWICMQRTTPHHNNNADPPAGYIPAGSMATTVNIICLNRPTKPFPDLVLLKMVLYICMVMVWIDA